MMGHVKEPVTEQRLQSLYEMFGPGKMDWNDRGYVAGVHPLELWLVAYLVQNPQAKWELVRDSSRQVRQEVYRWLFKSRSKIGKDLRIRSVLEADAFQFIHASWKRQGFPFQRLVPSLATAIGSSGDTPAALAELAGVILNDGVRLPNRRVDRLRFAEGTPFETRVVQKDTEPVRVFASEVARQLHKEMLGVVEFGTARRAFQSVKDLDGTILPVAGKTGTGDNRVKTFATVGKARNRTATFVFTVGDRYFGTVVAYVPGEEAGTYKFSSALPVSVFKLIVPDVVKVLDGGPVPSPMVVPERKPVLVPPVAQVVATKAVEPSAAEPKANATPEE
jgi:membrane peptidoglycan carboxypeptidase